MSDAVSGGLPCLDTLETITIAGAHIHTKRVTGGPDAGLAPNGILLLLLHDVRNILSEPNVSEQAALSRVNKLQKRFFDFDELGISVSTCAISAIKNKHDIPENIVKQIKTSSKANGLWFVTIDAAMKIVFKFCSPQDAIRFSLDLSPFLVSTYAAATDPLGVLESVGVDDLPREFQAAMEARMKEKRSKLRFSGSDAVDWLVRVGAAATRTRAVEVGSRLLSSGLFRAVGHIGTASKESSNAGIVDKGTEYYTFEMSDEALTAASRPLLSSRSSTSSRDGTPPANPHGSTTPLAPLNLKAATSKSAIGNRTGSGVLTATGQQSPSSVSRSPSHTPPISGSASSTASPFISQPYSVYILGADRSGKTSVWSALTGKRSGTASVKAPFDRPWNHVQLDRITIHMDHEEFPHQQVSLSVWDFDTHQNSKYQPHPGLSSLPYFVHRAYINRFHRASALVVFDVNSLDLVELDYWVASITQHQPAAPIIIVGTHSDTVSAKTKSKIKLFVSKRYAKVKNVRGYITISTKSTSDIDKLRSLLLQHSLPALTAQMKRERPKLSLDPSLEHGIELVSQQLNNLRLNGGTFVPLADIRLDLLENGIPEDQVEAALNYLAANNCFIRIPESLDQFTGLYGKPECDIKHWAILDFDYPFKLQYALNAAPPMLKMRGLISLATVIEAWKAVDVPHEFMLDLLAYMYHMMRAAYCMVSLLIHTVMQEKAIVSAAAAAEEAAAQHAKHHTHATTSTRIASQVRPPPLGSQTAAMTQQKVLARVPNPDAHCFSIPSAIPRTFDQKLLGWTRPQKNELVRVYAFERMPGQMLERACIQLVLAMLTQLRTPFLANSNQQPSQKPPQQAKSERKSEGKEGKPRSFKKPKRRPAASSLPPTDSIAGHRSASDSTLDVDHNVHAKNRSDRQVSTHSPSRRRRDDDDDSVNSKTEGRTGSINLGTKSPRKKSRDVSEHDDSHSSRKERTSSRSSNTSSSTDSTATSSPPSSVASTPSPTPSPSPLQESKPHKERRHHHHHHRKSSTDESGSGVSPKSRKNSEPSIVVEEEPTSPRAQQQQQAEGTSTTPVDANETHPKANKQEFLQALQDVVCEQIEWTHQGIGFTVSGENGFSARLYSIEGPQRETALVIRVTSDTFSGSSRGLRLILDNINAFVLWEYKNALSDIFIPCSCVDCIKARTNPKFVPLPVFKSSATFTFEECERAIGSGFTTLPCSVYGNEVPLDVLVPDLVMSDLENFHADYEDIVKETELARSSNGIVYRGKYQGETVAIKEISVKLANGVVDAAASEYFADFRHEVWVSSLLKHENVVGLKAFAIKSVEDEATGERIAQLAIVMEFIPHGDLYDWLHEPKVVLDWDMRLRILEETAQGMHFLHNLNPPILHHDLKSANIFIVDKSPEAPVICRVGDFGEARTNFSYNSRERVDNPLWLAPEVMQKGRYEMFADVYAFGIIMWEVCSRDHPFDEFPEGKSDFRSTLEDAIIRGLRPTIDNKIEPELPLSATSNVCIPLFAELAKECWSADRYKRPTFARIISTLQDIRAQMSINEAKVLEDAVASPVVDINGFTLDSEHTHHHHTGGADELSETQKEWVLIVESAERASDDALSIAALHSATHSSKTSPRAKQTIGLVNPRNELEDHASAVGSAVSDAVTASAEEKETVASTSESTNADENQQQAEPEADRHSSDAAIVPTKSASAEIPSLNASAKLDDISPSPSVLAVSSSKTSSGDLLPSNTRAQSHSSQPKQRAITLSGDALPKMTWMDSEDTDLAASPKNRMLFGVVALNSNATRRTGGHSPSFEALLSGHANASAKNTTPLSGIGLRKRLAASTMIPINALPDTDHYHSDSDSD